MRMLSVLIPTYSRSDALNVTLEELTRLCSNLPIDIIVSDNASPTGFDEIKHRWSGLNNIFFHKQSKNLGITKNILWLINQAKTPYVFVYGDDDAPRRDLFTLLISHLESNSPKITKLVHEYRETNDFIRAFDAPFEGQQEFRGFAYVPYSECILPAFEEKAGFITSHIFERKALLATIKKISGLSEWNSLCENVYLTKLYTMWCMHDSRGYWTHPEVLIHQRVPSGNSRNFFSTPQESYGTAIVAPAECYSALREIEPEFARSLLAIHFSKTYMIASYRKIGIPRLDFIRTIVRHRPKLSKRQWLRLFHALMT